MNRRENSGWLKHWDFILLDILCMQLSFAIAYWIVHGFGNPYVRKDYQYQAMVLVVSQNYCNRHSFVNSVNQFDFVDSRILGIVINRVVESGRRYYGKYGYKKGYYRGYYGYSKTTAALSKTTNTDTSSK
jgi:hypothetical protein